MTASLNHEDQEQIDQIRQFWSRYGTSISILILIIALVFSVYQGWLWWKRDQSMQAAHLFSEFTTAHAASDTEKTQLVFKDLQERYPKTVFTQQAALLHSDLLQSKGGLTSAKNSLKWLIEKGGEPEYRSIAVLRLSALLIDDNRLEESLTYLQKARGYGFDALIDDRVGDIYTLQNKTSEAIAAYKAAWNALDEKSPYRKQIEFKMSVLGADISTLSKPAVSS